MSRSCIELLESRVFLSGSAAARVLRPGELDRAFGAGGYVAGAGEPAALADGKILALVEDASAGTVRVRRYNPDGSADATFGDGGAATLPPAFTPAGVPNRGLTVQPDDKPVVVGGSDSSGGIRLVRLRTDGTPDPTFGTGGVFFSNILGTAADVVVQADGKIVVACDVVTPARVPTETNSNAVRRIELIRVTSAGVLDTTFGSGGVAEAGPTPPERLESASEVFALPDGRLLLGSVVSAGTGPGLVPTEAAVQRFNNDGALDPLYNHGQGRLTVAGFFGPADFDVQFGRNKVLVGGAGRRGFQVAAFDLDDAGGDGRFGQSGVAATTFRHGGDLKGAAMAFQPDGAVVLGGVKQFGQGSAGGVGIPGRAAPVLTALMRLTPTGRLDRRYGRGGVQVVAEGSTYTNLGPASLWLATQPADGKALLSSGGSISRHLAAPEATLVVLKGGRLTIFGTKAGDAIAITANTDDPTRATSVSVSVNGVTRTFAYGTGGVTDIRLAWPGHGARRGLVPPVSGTLEELIGQG